MGLMFEKTFPMNDLLRSYVRGSRCILFIALSIFVWSVSPSHVLGASDELGIWRATDGSLWKSDSR